MLFHRTFRIFFSFLTLIIVILDQYGIYTDLIHFVCLIWYLSHRLIKWLCLFLYTELQRKRQWCMYHVDTLIYKNRKTWIGIERKIRFCTGNILCRMSHTSHPNFTFPENEKSTVLYVSVTNCFYTKPASFTHFFESPEHHKVCLSSVCLSVWRTWYGNVIYFILNKHTHISAIFTTTISWTNNPSPSILCPPVCYFASVSVCTYRHIQILHYTDSTTICCM